MEITSEMIRAFQGGSGYGGDILGADVERGLQAVLSMPEAREAVLAEMSDWELEQASVARRMENE